MKADLTLCSVPRRPPLLLRLLAISMALVLVTVRLGSFTEEVFVTPVEDAIFDIAFIAPDDSTPQGKPLLNKTKRALDCDLPRTELQPPVHTPIVQQPPRYVPSPLPEAPASEIFIPPESCLV